MPRLGDVYENPVTGEYAVVLRGSDDRGHGPLTVHLTARPNAAVVGEHVHPDFEERFMVVRGRLAARIAGEETVLHPGERATVPPGTPHDWWNPSDVEDADVLVEVHPARANADVSRFELMIANLFGLARDGKVDRKGRPKPLQAAVLAREFADVIVFTRPPRPVQHIALAVLAPIGALLGYRAIDPTSSHPLGQVTPDPEILAAAGLAGTGAVPAPGNE
jgi:mannose-6-phosphate isomerase-like protein (cupin superfamily)